MWCWRRIKKISWTDRVRNEEVLLRAKEQGNTLHEIRKWKANWIGHILRRNWLLQQVIEGKIKGEMGETGRRGRRRRKLLDDLKEIRGYSLLDEETLDRPMWRAGFGRGFGPVVRQTTKRMNGCQCRHCWRLSALIFVEMWWYFVSRSVILMYTFNSCWSVYVCGWYWSSDRRSVFVQSHTSRGL